MSEALKEVIETVSCPNCNARIGRGCWWFYGYDEAAAHPERLDRYTLHVAEREKLKQWNAASSSTE